MSLEYIFLVLVDSQKSWSCPVLGLCGLENNTTDQHENRGTTLSLIGCNFNIVFLQWCKDFFLNYPLPFFQQWHAFSVPELQNFLVILEKEEAERVRAVEQKYAMYRQKLQQALEQLDP